MSKYVPPHKRKSPADVSAPDDSLDNSKFPTLSNVGAGKSSSTWSSSHLTFENSKKKAEISRKLEESMPVTVGIFVPSSKSVYSAAKSQDFDDAEESANADDAEDDGWTTVTRKVRRKKTAVEKYEEELREEEEKKKKEEEEKKESVWNDVNEYETYWDERRY